MHYITEVRHAEGYSLLLTFDGSSVRKVDLQDHLDGEVFEPLKDPELFRTARLNADIDTVVWDNGADMAPDFLYAISVPVEANPLRKVAEGRAIYEA